MRHLLRTSRVLTMQVNADPTPAPDGRRVIVVGRIPRPACSYCGDFQAVTVTVDGVLASVVCPECPATSPASAGVVDDVHEEDEAAGYEDDEARYAEAVA